MFEEMEELSTRNTNNNNNKKFPIDGITNKEIGKKIKSYAKVFLKIEIVGLVIAAFFILVGFLDIADYAGSEAILILIFGGLGLFLTFVTAYFMFLITSGFGALIEDTNAIKALQMRTEKSSTKKANYDDLPKL